MSSGASLISEGWGVDARDYVAQARPLIERHRYRGLIEAYGLLHDQPGAWAGPLHTVQFVDLEMSSMPLIRYLAAADPSRQNAAPPLSAWPGLHSDGTTGDCERIIAAYGGQAPEMVANAAELLRRVSPGNPLAIAVAIENDWDKVQGQAAAWEKDHGTHPAVARALARRYTSLSRWVDAERCWKQYIDVAQDQQGYYGLANVRLAQGDRAGWLKAMTDFLKQEDYGLQHANAQVAIAGWYVSEGKFAEAQPYAEAAAQTRAQWAMMSAAEVAEGLQQWDKAEAWVREASEHYNQPLSYFDWCVRTGHGDQNGARDAARPAAETLATRDDRASQVEAATFYLETGERKQAAAVLMRMCFSTGDPWAGLILALDSQEHGETEIRDKELAAVIEKGPHTNAGFGSPRMELVELAKMFQSAWKANAPLDLQACGKLAGDAAANHEVNEASNVQSLVGKFLLLRGQKDEAIKWFNLSAAGRGNSKLRTLAIVELRSFGARSDREDEMIERIQTNGEFEWLMRPSCCWRRRFAERL